MSDGFYRAFEERYRGSREDILSRLQVYRPWLEALKAAHPGACAIDLGCGRGEWLEILRENGIPATGVDQDAGMIEGLAEAGLDVRKADAISYLRGLGDGSQGLVSGFHIAEHLPFDELRTLIREAHRVLVPGGLLLLETPNPENLTVGATTFYMDPTHARPLPPALLGFVPEHEGFARVVTVRLREPRGLEGYAEPSLENVLADVSPDFAVVAQKAGGSANAAFDALFALRTGVTLKEVVVAYDAHARKLEHDLWRSIEHTQQEVARAHERIARAEANMRDAQENIRHILASKSWRITAPLRAVADLLKRVAGR